MKARAVKARAVARTATLADVAAVVNEVAWLHQERRRDRDGFTERWCRECQQNWPCPTAEVIDRLWEPSTEEPF